MFQRKADGHGKIELILAHAVRERRQRLGTLDHRRGFGIKIGMAGALNDLVRKHVAGAIDDKAQQDNTLFVTIARPGRISLELL